MQKYVRVQDDGVLNTNHSLKEATDILWTMLSVRNWEQLIIECGWSQAEYVETTKSLVRRLFVVENRPSRRADQ